MKKNLAIKSASYINDYKISIIFKDGTERLVDFYDFLSHSGHPEIRKYLEMNRFKSFKIYNEQLMWGDFDLLFPIEELYSGKISA
jgi:hypothetical protein